MCKPTYKQLSPSNRPPSAGLQIGAEIEQIFGGESSLKKQSSPTHATVLTSTQCHRGPWTWSILTQIHVCAGTGLSAFLKHVLCLYIGLSLLFTQQDQKTSYEADRTPPDPHGNTFAAAICSAGGWWSLRTWNTNDKGSHLGTREFGHSVQTIKNVLRIYLISQRLWHISELWSACAKTQKVPRPLHGKSCMHAFNFNNMTSSIANEKLVQTSTSAML